MIKTFRWLFLLFMIPFVVLSIGFYCNLDFKYFLFEHLVLGYPEIALSLLGVLVCLIGIIFCNTKIFSDYKENSLGAIRELEEKIDGCRKANGDLEGKKKHFQSMFGQASRDCEEMKIFNKSWQDIDVKQKKEIDDIKRWHKEQHDRIHLLEAEKQQFLKQKTEQEQMYSEQLQINGDQKEEIEKLKLKFVSSPVKSKGKRNTKTKKK